MNRSTEPTAQSRTNPTLSATRAATLAIRPWNRYQNLSLPRKFSLLLIALLIPLIVLSVAYGYDRWQAYTAAKLESAGIPHLVTLRQLLELLPAHRLLTRDTMEGRPDAQGQLAEVRQSIEAAIAHLDENPGNRALALGGHQHWQEFKARWSGLVQAGGAKGLPEIIATHDLLINSTTSMLDVVGERSGLILDSKVETFRLVNLVINQLPLVMEKTTQLRRTALGLNKLGESSELERILLTTLQNETAQTLIRMRANIESALASDPDLRPRIENEFRALEHAVDLFQSRLRETYESDARNRLSHAEVTRLSNDVLDRNFEVYDAALSSLTLALEGRIASNRNLMIVKAIAILFGLSLIMVAFNHMSRSVVGRLRHIREVFTNLSNGQFNNRITIAIQDEIGEVLQALAAMQAKLGADRSQLQRRAIEIGRLKSALDSASAGILVTDKDYKVTYANPAFQRTMER
ncbi:MAG: HAMP domain-containing protein, partial [Thiotrichales bacterium]